jgi:endonuclease-3
MHPDAHCELDHRTPFELLVATVLSAQTTDKLVNKVTPRALRALPRREGALGGRAVAGGRRAARRERARHVQPEGQEHRRALARASSKSIAGEVPRTLDELVELPGVGRKTANVVLGVAFGAPEGVVVDTHVSASRSASG